MAVVMFGIFGRTTENSYDKFYSIGVSRRKCLEGQRRGRQLLDSKYM